MIRAYHFTNGLKLRDGTPLVLGQTYRHDGALKLCESGLHASRTPHDALKYAPGSMLSVVDCGGPIVEDNDKLVCTERTVVKIVDCDRLLRVCAADCAAEAMVVADWWDDRSWEIVHLIWSGDWWEIDAAARAAAWDAARDAAWAAAWDAAWDAARAARAAALDAAWAAAGDAAWAAAGAAARAATRAATRAAAVDDHIDNMIQEAIAA